MLKVRPIGTIVIKCDGELVTLSSRAAQSLFAYLSLTTRTLHRREKLAGMFWPDETEEKARAYPRNEHFGELCNQSAESLMIAQICPRLDFMTHPMMPSTVPAFPSSNFDGLY